MNSTPISLAYREAAVGQATPEQLAIAMYDALIADIQRALEAMQRNAIEARSNALKHGFRVLGQLQAQVSHGSPAADQLIRFYTYLRQRMLSAQFRADPHVLAPLIPQILTVRQAFEQVDARRISGGAPEVVLPFGEEPHASVSFEA